MPLTDEQLSNIINAITARLDAISRRQDGLYAKLEAIELRVRKLQAEVQTIVFSEFVTDKIQPSSPSLRAD